MKIITWNCNMAFRKKAAFILPHKPDILIVPECEHPNKLLFPPEIQQPTDILWIGSNQNKGLAIFSFNDFHVKEIDNHNRDLKMIIPICVTCKKIRFNLFAVWAYNPVDKDGKYVEQIWKAIHHYEPIIGNKKTILIGDFNSNTIWDRKNRAGNHSNVVKFLKEKGIFSTYHIYHNQVQGKEQHQTLFMYRHKEKAYHIDYCFVSVDFLKKLQCVEVGGFDLWRSHSDHVPLMITFA